MSGITLFQANLISKVVDSELGIIEELAGIGLQASEQNLHIAIGISQNASAISPLTRNSPRPRRDRQAAGAGLSYSTAVWSTIGESLERYSASIIDPEKITVSKLSELIGRVVSPLDFVRFSEEQQASSDFPFLRFSSDEKIAWVKGIHILTGEEVWIPSDHVYLAHAGGNSRLDRGYSTGLAAHRIPEKAASNAIREVVERDAYMSRYLISDKPPEIPSSILNSVMGEMYNTLACREFGVRVFDLTNEMSLPTALCHVVLPDGKGIASGASCQVSQKACLEKAITECLHTYNWLIDMNRWDVYTELHDIRDFVDHVSSHRNAEATARYAQFLGGPEGAPMMDTPAIEGNPSEELKYIVEQVEGAGHGVYLVDITSSDIEELGFVVFRAIIPSLQPIYSGSKMYHLDPRRLQEIARKRGLEWGNTIINTHPHPFP